jgi:hypothetical protein
MSNPSRKHEDVFISYAREDQAIAARLAENLKSKGISVFWDANIRNGLDWRDKLEQKLGGVACVLVLWSKHSVGSEWVLEEADFGKSRQILVSARLDDCKLPIGHRRIHTDDLSNWREAPPAGIVGVLRRIGDLLEAPSARADRSGKDAELRNIPLRAQPAHTSISDHELDKAAVVGAIVDMPEAVNAVENGYGELQSAQDAAKSVLNDRVSSRFYAAAAEHFGQALTIINDARLREARDGRTVGYFLSMEQANALVYAEPRRDERDDPIGEAIAIYTSLSRDARYKNDVPVHFRLGCALVKQSRTEDSLSRAVRCLRKARKLAVESYGNGDSDDALLNEGTWLKIEIAKQLGFCNYMLSELPGIAVQKRRKYLDDAIAETAEASNAAALTGDRESLANFTVLKAQGNLIFLLAQRLREGRGEAGDIDRIRTLIASIKEPAAWEVAQNQVHIIDDIAFAAATIGDWQLAFEEADRNVDNFNSLAVPNGLQPEEMAMDARAKEIRYFARLQLEASARRAA